jgi:uncharacterized membrane protein
MFANAAFAYGSRDYEEFAEYKSKYRILWGILMIVGGGFLSYDGFRNIKIDISNPSIDTSNLKAKWYDSFGGGSPDPDRPLSYNLVSEGTVRNSGNVDLKSVYFEVRYKCQSDYAPETAYNPNTGRKDIVAGEGVIFDKTHTALTNLQISETDSWSNSYSYPTGGTNPPIGSHHDVWYPDPSTDPNTHLVEVVNVKLEWDKKYKKEMNNVYEGIAGVLLAGGGIYLLVDYIVGLKRFDYYTRKHNMKIYVANNYDEFKLMVSKRI